MGREWLREDLAVLDSSIFFVIVIIGSVLLSLRALGLERRRTAEELRGGEAELLPSPTPSRLGASALILGALGFFFCQALEELEEERDGPAWNNALAAALVLAAALLRLNALLGQESSDGGTPA